MQFRWLAVLGAVSPFRRGVPGFCWKGRLRPLSRFPFYWQLRGSRRHKEPKLRRRTQINNDTDIVAGNAFIFGYRWKSLPIRTDIEIAYRYRFDHDLRDTGLPVRGYENNLATLSGLVNLTYEYRNASSFTPYFGGGVGWAQNHSSVRLSDLSNGGEQNFDERTHNFAWGAHLGVTWRFADRWDTDLGYRFISLGELESGEPNAVALLQRMIISATMCFGP